MAKIDWMKEVKIRKDDLLRDLQSLIRIKSVLNEDQADEKAPLGKEVKQALDYMLDIGSREKFTAKNVDNLAGHLELGEGEELIGVLCHVDVVPSGDGWTVDPFGGEVKDGKIFGRGAIDDKGPTMAAFYAMKIVKELNLPFNKRIRMIIGTDEESNWRCVDRYFQTEEMPSVGFAPDADFPIIHAEKGIADFNIIQTSHLAKKNKGDSWQVEVESFESGRRYNMVPDYAKATIVVQNGQTEFVQTYNEYLKDNGLDGRYHIDNGYLILEMIGESAHGMEPDLGKSAGLFLAEFLSQRNLNPKAAEYFQFVSQYLVNESRGKKLNIHYQDDITGELTVNIGILSYTSSEGGKLGVNMRYSVTYPIEEKKAELESLLKESGFKMADFDNSSPHHVEKDHPFIQTLARVYEEQTGEKAELLSIGGGTYARSLKTGVAYGALFPGRSDVAHQKDEYMFVEDLLKATAIYAQALYELACDGKE